MHKAQMGINNDVIYKVHKILFFSKSFYKAPIKPTPKPKIQIDRPNPHSKATHKIFCLSARLVVQLIRRVLVLRETNGVRPP